MQNRHYYNCTVPFFYSNGLIFLWAVYKTKYPFSTLHRACFVTATKQVLCNLTITEYRFKKLTTAITVHRTIQFTKATDINRKISGRNFEVPENCKCEAKRIVEWVTSYNNRKKIKEERLRALPSGSETVVFGFYSTFPTPAASLAWWAWSTATASSTCSTVQQVTKLTFCAALDTKGIISRHILPSWSLGVVPKK